jgi:amidophosphoribosyltransferase
MGGFFGVVSKQDCLTDLFYGTDYHSHLGTSRGGMVVLGKTGFVRAIHNIENAQFRSKFEYDLRHMHGDSGIGCISDTEAQPLIIRSQLGHYALTTVGRINNIETLAQQAFAGQTSHFLEMSGSEINPTEMVASLIDQGASFVDGIRHAQSQIDGSCSMMLLTAEGIYAARDRFGRTPVILGGKDGAYCVTMESCALPNLDFRFQYELGPGEIVHLTPEGLEHVSPPGDVLRICAFLWVYYGYPASTYEGVNVEEMRNRSGAALARKDSVKVDMVAGVPDSGIGHAIGYANESRVPYSRPFVKYTPTWPRSFMPQDQDVRNLVARMKLIPVYELIRGKRLLLCEDSIVRGTQLRETIQRLYEYGAKEVHMRPACPPLVYGCRFLNFSRSRSEFDLAGRWAIRELEGEGSSPDLAAYAVTDSLKYRAMVERICTRLNLSSLRYQTLPDMVAAIGLPRAKVCTYCWDGAG